MTRSQVNKLYDYTKFHIGLYAGLVSALIGALSLGTSVGVPHQAVFSLKITLVCFVLAGGCGGIVGSTISLDQDALVHERKLGPLRAEVLAAEDWAHLEHGFFWIGIIVSAVAFLWFIA